VLMFYLCALRNKLIPKVDMLLLILPFQYYVF